MKQKNFAICTLAFILILSLTACSQKTSLSIEEYAIKSMDWEGEALMFEPVEGTREDVLAKRQVERSRPAQTFTLPVELNDDTLNVIENYTDNLVSVDVYRNDLLELSIDAGVISPINNFRGIWLDEGYWFLEVAHVEENPVDPNAAFIIWGEIFQDGESLNERYGYDESFNFQILSDKPFYFFSKDENLGFSYDGKETILSYSEIPHYLCCSAAAFNPLPAENMVAFYASRGDQNYYIEIGDFE